VTLLKQAMLHDPLTGAVCDTEEIWQLADEMLVAQERWLPQYAPAQAPPANDSPATYALAPASAPPDRRRCQNQDPQRRRAFQGQGRRPCQRAAATRGR